jgi:hypothetical protein
LVKQWGSIMLTNLLNAFLVDSAENLNSQLSELKELRRRVRESSAVPAELGRTDRPDSHFSAPDLFNRDVAAAPVLAKP